MTGFRAGGSETCWRATAATDQLSHCEWSLKDRFSESSAKADTAGLGARFVVDGQPLKCRNAPAGVDPAIWEINTRRFGGRLFMWTELSDQLSSGSHVLEIHPVITPECTGQLRIESICAAGA